MTATNKLITLELLSRFKEKMIEKIAGDYVAKEEGSTLLSSADKAKLDGLNTTINTAIGTALASVNHFKVVDDLPTVGDQNAIYLIPKDGSGTNVKTEFIYVDGSWEQIGDTDPNLDGYLKESDLVMATEAEINALFLVEEEA